MGDEEKMRGILVAVNTVSGACIMRQPEEDKSIKCKITDPALKTPLNVYTHALDSKTPVELTGKPVIKGGKLSTFYVSDAKPIE